MDYDLKIRQPSEADYTTTEAIALKAAYLIAAAHAAKHGPEDAAAFLTKASKNLIEVAVDIASAAKTLAGRAADGAVPSSQDIRWWLTYLETIDHEVVEGTIRESGDTMAVEDGCN
jgi:hypothetical protein